MVIKMAFSSATTWEQQLKHEQKFFQEIFKRPLIFLLRNSESMKGLFEIDRQNTFFKKISKCAFKTVDNLPLNVLAIRGIFFQTQKNNIRARCVL